MPTPPGTPSPKKGRPGLPRGSFQTSNASQKLRALLSGPSQTSGSMQGLDGASSINEYSCTPSKFLIFNADGVVVFTFEEKAPDDQINTWECLNWKEFTEEERDRALRLYLSTCIECWRTKHFNSVIDDAKALSFKSLDEALEHDKSIMDNLYILIADLSPAAREEQDRIFNWYTKIWEELEAKDDHELLTIYAAVEDEFRLSQDFRRILASKARMLKDINVLRQLSVEDVVFLLFMIKIRRIRAMDMGKALAKKKMAEEALAKKTKAKDKTKVKKKKKTKDREKNAREKADWAYSKSVDEFIATELKPTTESETIRLKRDFEIVVMLLEGEHEIVATWVIATDVIIADLLYKVYQHVKADLQSNIDESYPGLQKEGSAVDPNDDEEPEASEVQYPQGKNSQAEDWNVDPDFDKGHTGPEAQKPQVEGWNMDPNVAEEFERILFQPFYNTHEYILGLVKKTDMAE
ncbi:hypothetical protein OCU04_005353 [Sclerotinia nivalis]|uniref:Uncharacterized protein n=1 Tax=Sclerotinia nivalis TaxID=352851 RepID=A0A9X0DMQ6_9HELO|nr:hypothetical protein OCU04_005353 [Sclerotinia nivalis]